MSPDNGAPAPGAPAPDAAPPANDLDRLLGLSVEAAVQLLSKDGEFYPFALAVTSEGEVVRPAIEPGSDHPTGEHVADLLLTALRQSSHTLRAASICSDVKIRSDTGEERDALRIALEAPEVDPLVVVVPYANQTLDEPFGMPGERQVFA